MKKYILGLIATLKQEFPNEKITISNGFLGVQKNERLKNSTYIGTAFYEIDGIVYSDYNTKNNISKKICTL